MSTMSAVVVQNGRIEIRAIPRPEPGPYQCLARTLCAATCNATDLRFLRNSKEKPQVLGHESVGRVVAVGAKVRNLREGDLVLRSTAVYPGMEIGGTGCALGGFSEYGLVTDVAAAEADGAPLPPAVAGYSRFQQKVAPEIDPKDATMMITLKETLSFARRAGVAAGKGFLIFGDGPVGQAFVKVASLLGAKPVVGVGHRADRLARLQALGADRVVNRKETPLAKACPERVADVVIDGIGDYVLINEAFPLMRPKSVYALYGISSTRQVAFDLTAAPREWMLHFFRMDEAETHDEITALIRSGRLNPREFYDAVLPFQKAAEAFELVAERKANKVVLTF